jgi:methylated-DNA-protein-cysteine methyltransferase-like protein
VKGWARVFAAVRRIPRGRVATYGQIAALAGRPGRAREVGYALSSLSDTRVPWQRVVNARGEISLRGDPGPSALQRRLLEREGVRFDARGRIDLARYGFGGRGRSRGSQRGTSRQKCS